MTIFTHEYSKLILPLSNLRVKMFGRTRMVSVGRNSDFHAIDQNRGPKGEGVLSAFSCIQLTEETKARASLR